MGSQWWSWALTAVGLLGFFLAGKKVWWCWYVNIANQILWATYALITDQLGFLVGTFAYTFVFVKNAYVWTVEHQDEKRWNRQNPEGWRDYRIEPMREDEM